MHFAVKVIDLVRGTSKAVTAKNAENLRKGRKEKQTGTLPSSETNSASWGLGGVGLVAKFRRLKTDTLAEIAIGSEEG